MAKRNDAVTPRSRVKEALRRLSLRSRERNYALKQAHYTCIRCGKKRSTAKGREVKVEAHHRDGIDWDGVIDIIIERIFQTHDKYDVLCERCHDELHANEKEAGRETD